GSGSSTGSGSFTGSAGSGSSAGSGGGCSVASMACSQCATCSDVVEVFFDDYKKLPSFIGTTSGLSLSSVSPMMGCSKAAGPERIYAVHPKFDGFLTASLTRAYTHFDSVLYARKGDCCTTDATAFCADSSSNMSTHLFGGETISFRVSQGDVW